LSGQTGSPANGRAPASGGTNLRQAAPALAATGARVLAADVLDAPTAPQPTADVLASSDAAPSADALEAEARADPVIREIMRTYPAELVEVRPIPRDQDY
jgi:hypothetical protein